MYEACFSFLPYVSRMSSQIYEIRFKGLLGNNAQVWFESFSVSYDNGETVLFGAVRDQSELIGIVSRLYELGVQLTHLNVVV